MMNRTTSRRRPARTVLAAVLSFPLAGHALAASSTFATEYSIAFAGVPVAKSSFRTEVSDGALTLKGDLSSAGLASVFASTSATSTVRGRVTDKGIVTTSYSMRFTSGKRSRQTEMTFKGGNVVDVAITPPRGPRPGLVPVEDSHKRNVVDPFLAAMIAADDPSKVCARTIRVFDGITRLDLVLRAAGTEQVSTGGYKGEAIKCSVRYVPVAGHRPEAKTVKFMAGGERASISFAAVPGSNIYAPVKALIRTEAGTVSIKATRFEQTGG
jgi:hypothetical protein